MKRVLILTFVAILAMTMASCDWDPTGIGTGGGTGSGHGNDSTKVDRDHDKKDRDGMMVRGMEGDVITTPCDYTFEVQSITVTENTNDAVTDRPNDRTVIVVIAVTHSDGTTESYTLTKESPSITIGDCTIHLKGVEPHKSRDTDIINHVATFAITTG